MENKRNHTLYTTMSNNIGQVRIENAQFQIDRLHKQDGGNWRIDTSEFMFVKDETDDNVHNPCELREGYVWITCEPKEKSTRELALEWWNNLSLKSRKVITNLTRLAIDSPLIGVNLTGREIEEIWRKEVGDLKLHKGEIVDKSYPEEFQKAYLKPNQKQFKEFNPELFKSYIDKFSDEDKLKAFKLLNEEFAYYSHEQMEIIQKSHDEQIKLLQNKILELSK